MSNEAAAQQAFAEVRERYNESYKSTNKKYDPESEGKPLAKRNKRNLNADLGSSVKGKQARNAFTEFTNLPHSEDMSIQEGNILWTMRAKALNCDELAKMACYRASILGMNTAVYTFAPPADHAVCLVGDLSNWKKAIEDARVREFKTKLARSDAWIVDVWLNTVCSISDYPAAAEAKLKKWGNHGKRIFWSPKEDEESWVMPSAEYMNTFLNAYISQA